MKMHQWYNLSSGHYIYPQLQNVSVTISVVSPCVLLFPFSPCFSLSLCVCVCMLARWAWFPFCSPGLLDCTAPESHLTSSIYTPAFHSLTTKLLLFFCVVSLVSTLLFACVNPVSLHKQEHCMPSAFQVLFLPAVLLQPCLHLCLHSCSA